MKSWWKIFNHERPVIEKVSIDFCEILFRKGGGGLFFIFWHLVAWLAGGGRGDHNYNIRMVPVVCMTHCTLVTGHPLLTWHSSWLQHLDIYLDIYIQNHSCPNHSRFSWFLLIIMMITTPSQNHSLYFTELASKAKVTATDCLQVTVPWLCLGCVECRAGVW